MTYTFLPPELQVSDFAKELALVPQQMSAYLMAEFLHRDWRNRRETELVTIDSNPVTRRKPRMFPTTDDRFVVMGFKEVDIANLTLLELPLDILLENLTDSTLLIERCVRHKRSGGVITMDFLYANARFAHNAWWRRNYPRLQQEGRGDVCVDLEFLPVPIRDETIQYNIDRVQLSWEFIQAKIGLFGTMGEYESPRLGLEQFLLQHGLFKAQTYNPQVGPGEWSSDLLAVEESMKSFIDFFVFFLGDPMDKVPEADGTFSISHTSPVSIAEVTELANNPGAQGAVIYDRRSLPKRALQQYDAILSQRVTKTTRGKLPVLVIEEGEKDINHIYEKVWELFSRVLALAA